MLKFSPCLITAGLLAAVMTPTAHADVALSSSVIRNGNGAINTSAGSATDIETFDFQNPASVLGSLTGLSIAFALEDGDTGMDDFDRGQLRLTLDGFDTGLLLDGFTGETPLDTDAVSLTLSLGSLNATLAQNLYSSLIDDSTLVVGILDADSDNSKTGPGDSPSGHNSMRIPMGTELTLTLIGTAPAITPLSPNTTVPEPATLALAGLGLAGLGLSRRRRPA